MSIKIIKMYSFNLNSIDDIHLKMDNSRISEFKLLLCKHVVC
jgi:hypothetical protein